MKNGESAVAASLHQRSLLLDDRRNAADRRADEDARRAPGRIPRCPRRPTPPGRPRRRAGRCGPSAAPPSAAIERRGSKPLHLGRDPHRVAARVECLDEAHAAPARDRRLPARRSVEPDRRHGPEARDGNAAHGGESVVAWGHAQARSSVPQSWIRSSPSRRWRPSSSASSRPVTAGPTSRSGTGSAACSRTRAASSALVAERQAAAPLLPGAAASRRAAAVQLGARRRDRDRDRRRRRLRRHADPPPPGREPHQPARRRDPGTVHRLRRARLEGEAAVAEAARRPALVPRTRGGGVRPVADARTTSRRQNDGSRTSSSWASTASSRSGSTARSSREAAAPS